MTIEELKAEWDYQLETVEYQQDHKFMKDNINKLLAVVEAAIYDRDAGNFIHADKTTQALDDLLGEK